MLTGWNSDVLAQSSEASKCQLSKYMSALLILILILIWGVTGFCFAQRYIGLPIWACWLVSLFFVTIVVMIERQIILTIEKTFSMVAFRAIIAFIMAIVGSTIFDQTMFGKDIDKQMANTIELQVADISKQRLRVIDEKLMVLRMEIDSIDCVNAALQADVNANPFVVQKSVTNTTTKLVMPDGQIKTFANPSVTTSQIVNPKQTVLKANGKTADKLREQEQKWTEKKQNVEEDVRRECKESVGFLEELEAMWDIVTTHKLAGVFYVVFFILLMSLELFVVVSKTVDKECDYEVAIKGAQEMKKNQLSIAFGGVALKKSKGL